LTTTRNEGDPTTVHSTDPDTTGRQDGDGSGAVAEWTPERTRDAVLDAVVRNLRGPLADPTGAYPGATPVTLAPGQRIDRPKDLSRLFVAADGHEILLEPPTARYVVGALYPVLNAAEEAELDAAQSPELPDSGDG
jgi:hypothetical protein